MRQFEKLHISITADNKITQTSAAILQMSARRARTADYAHAVSGANYRIIQYAGPCNNLRAMKSNGEAERERGKKNEKKKNCTQMPKHGAQR